MKIGAILVSILWVYSPSCSPKHCAGGGGGSTSNPSTVTADVAIQEDDPTAIVQPGESVSLSYSLNAGNLQFYADATNSTLIGSACDAIATTSNTATSFAHIRVENGSIPQTIGISWRSVGF